MSTPKKYIDLIGQITERLDVPRGNIRLGIHEALAYLDRNPAQVPGRTITASEFDEAVESCITEDATVPPHKFAERLGVVCVPDPEPTESVPGRTITESDYSDITEWARNFPSRGWEGRTVLAGAGITIVPDPAPGRTITESELHSALRDYNAALYTEIDTANRLGLPVAPDSEAHRNTTKEGA